MLKRATGVATAWALVLAAAAPPLLAQPSPAPQRVSQSVRGRLEGVDTRLGTVVMKGDDGKGMSWRFGPAVLAEVGKLEAGAPMIVIYRQTAANEKRVTAVAFPGTASTAVYVNFTGDRVVLRSSGAVGEACGGADAGPVTESVILPGGRAESKGGCWCCVPAGGTCTPGNRTGQGQAFLEHCFQ